MEWHRVSDRRPGVVRLNPPRAFIEPGDGSWPPRGRVATRARVSLVPRINAWRRGTISSCTCARMYRIAARLNSITGWSLPPTMSNVGDRTLGSA